MSTTKLNGYDVLVLTGTSSDALTEIAASRECSLTINNELIEKASPTESSVREYLAGRYDWSIEVSGLYALNEHVSLVSHLLAGNLLYIGFALGSETLTGTAYIEGFSANGPLRGKTTYNVKFRGSGALATS